MIVQFLLRKIFPSLFLCMLCFVGVIKAQTGGISGVVEDEKGVPLSGATVRVKGAVKAVITLSKGSFHINAAQGDSLMISMIGFRTALLPAADNMIVKLLLSQDTQLNDVVVTALGIKREKKSLGYAIQEVGGQELTKTNQQNMLNSLAGKAAGVQITASSGAVGSSSRIVLRGNNSFSSMGNGPLFVVDGVPVNNYASAVGANGSVDYGDALSEIDPSNIESVSILKGANAAALYGYQAANGVVLITTKNGKGAGKQYAVSYSGGYSFEKVYILPKYQNSYGQGLYGDEYSWKLNNEGLSYQDYASKYGFSYLDGLGDGVNDGTDESWGPRLDDGLLLKQYNSPPDADGNRTPTPWISHPDNTKDFFQTGFTMDNSVAFSTNSENSSTRIGLSNQRQVGTVPNTDQERYTVSLNSIQDIGRKLKINTVANYVRTENDNLVGQGYNSDNPLQSIGGWFGRQVDMKDLKAHYKETLDNGYPYNWNSNYHDNPYFSLYNNTHSRYKDRLYGNMSLSYKFNEWLNVMLRGGGDVSSETRKEIQFNGSNATLTGTGSWSGGAFTDIQTNLYALNGDLIFTGSGNLLPKFSLSYTAGASYLDNSQKINTLGASELTVPNLFTIKNAAGVPKTDMFYSHARSNSLYGEASFGYDNYLYLDLTARNDWNSSLPMDNWSYFYPSASLSWIFTQNFHINQNILSYGKLRASWAKVGNGTSPYQLQSVYNANTSAFNGVTLYNLSETLPPLNLKPESSKSLELGAELKFLKDRISVDATYYYKITTNQIMQVDLSGSTGYTAMVLNAGEIQNKGIELQMSFGILRSERGLNWDMDINWSKNNNKVNKLYTDPTTGQALTSYTITSAWSLTIDAVPGQPFGTIRGAHFQHNADGAIVVGNDGLPEYNSTPEILGNITPDWIGGVNNKLSYRNFNFSFLIDSRKGGDIFSVTQWFGYQSGVLQATVQNGIRENGLVLGKDIMSNEKFEKEDRTSDDIRVRAQDYFHSLWGGKETGIVDGSFVKLREVEFGYSLPQSLMQKVHLVQGINISVFANNVALLHISKSNVAHIDPETGFGVGNDGLGIEQYQIPSNRSIGVKLNVKF